MGVILLYDLDRRSTIVVLISALLALCFGYSWVMHS